MEQQQENQSQKRVTKMMWFSHVGLVFVFLFIAYQVMAEAEQEISFKLFELNSPLFFSFLLLSIGELIFSHQYFPRIFFKKEDVEKLSTGKIELVQFGLASAVAVYGLTLFFWQGSFFQLVILCALSLLSLYLLYQKNEGWR